MREIKFRAWDEDSKSFVRSDDIGMWAFCQWADSFADIEFQQYTGLKDKNGVEIYEGDILASDPLYDGFQTFSTIEMGWSSVDGNEYGWHWRNGPPVRPVDMVDERYRVIGNIYENPELLEANQ